MSAQSIEMYGGVREQTNKQTDSLTDWCFDREIYANNGLFKKIDILLKCNIVLYIILIYITFVIITNIVFYLSINAPVCQ